ncbi:cytochrome P450 [Streptomyces sp. NPDC005805]|uniref:cytochrome P450 family protein n=1 Tax=Streptomyces sp. NPDC005805 TaxID=3157068 RepID=UPI0033FC979E
MTVVDLASFGPGFTADPYPWYARLRERGPVHEVRGTDGGRFWLVVGHEEARAALADPRLSKSPATVGTTMLDEEVIGPNLLGLDPPRHTRLRRLVARGFTMRRVERLAPRVREITGGLLDALPATGRADLVESFAFPLPIVVICELLGIPAADRDDFRTWSNAIVAPVSAESEREAVYRLRDYLDELIEAKREAARRAGSSDAPDAPDDDLISALLRTLPGDGPAGPDGSDDSDSDADADALTVPELSALAYLLLIAGHETTVNLIGNAVRALLTHPDQLAAVRADPALIDGVIEETLRWDGPVENATVRFTAEPVAYGDGSGETTVPAGEVVLVGLAGADRDPERFPDPSRFDIRRDTRGHLAFGHGLHFCLGAPLARLEARIALRALLDRCPDLALDEPDAPYDWMPGLLIRGVRRLPARW